MGEAEAATPVSTVHADYSENYVQDNTGYVPETVHSDVAKSDTAESDITVTAAEPKETTVSETAPKAPLAVDWRSPKLWITIWAFGAFVSMGITVFSYLHFNFKLKKKLMEPDSFTKSVYASIQGRKPAL